VPGLATVVAVAFTAPSVAALRPHSFKGFISKSSLLLLLLPLLTLCTPVFQALRLLNDAVDKGYGVKDEATVACQG